MPSHESRSHSRILSHIASSSECLSYPQPKKLSTGERLRISERELSTITTHFSAQDIHKGVCRVASANRKMR